MVKLHKFDELSAKVCIKCNRKLKKRLEKNTLCFTCHQCRQATTDNPCNTAREVRTGKVMGRKNGIYVVK